MKTSLVGKIDGVAMVDFFKVINSFERTRQQKFNVVSVKRIKRSLLEVLEKWNGCLALFCLVFTPDS